ncbi:HD domain-containing protein [Kribbella sancticallisti]|uniref:HD domain-containing protein n=1 Tax=Kribbella sancticallisti TaxID=460087 RepID=A0ABP4N1F3_9ACTN
MQLDAIPVPDTAPARLSREVAERYYSRAMLNHCLRSYYFAAGAGLHGGLAFDEELLYVAAMLHDLGLAEPFDAHRMPFEAASGHVAWVFGAGAGWPVQRRERLSEVIRRHMGDAVDPGHDVESHLLEAATSLDIGGTNANLWPHTILADVIHAYPRLELADEFAGSFDAQAARKPDSAAARATRGGIRQRLANNALETIKS